MPSHNHAIGPQVVMPNGESSLFTLNDLSFDGFLASDNINIRNDYATTNAEYVPDHVKTNSISQTGGSQSHNNIQPYLSVYM